MRILVSLLANSLLASVAERFRLAPAQHGSVAVAVGQRRRQPPGGRGRGGFLPPTADVGAPRVVQSSGSRPAALVQVPSSRHLHTVTGPGARHAERTDDASRGGPHGPRGRAGREAMPNAMGERRAVQVQGSAMGPQWPSEGVAVTLCFRPWASGRLPVQDRGAQVRPSAAEAVGDGGGEAVLRAVGELRAALDDADAKVLQNAAEGGRRRKEEEGGELLYEARLGDGGVPQTSWAWQRSRTASPSCRRWCFVSMIWMLHRPCQIDVLP
ncbi:unnamed protein product [Prorocentrum cordatum]|uniref:Uncharacterized protein n=1 Tax=Prorocentrum cordatum TaxID=2364126 RepID=A0ABN9QT55_9DINO|nr:unnamed protein product [Polarella glacialis]